MVDHLVHKHQLKNTTSNCLGWTLILEEKHGLNFTSRDYSYSFIWVGLLNASGRQCNQAVGIQ